MADYYTHFSCTLDVGNRANVEQALALYAHTLPNEDGLTFPDGFRLEPPADEGTELWIHDDGRGDVELVISFVLLCADRLFLEGRWGFEYGLTASRPLLDGFGGGAHVVDLSDRSSLSWTSTSEWLAGVLAGGDGDA
ncbi:hypothetical protein [Sphingobium yanoikuyae]|jgi:hypothetical protein|uniref:hypothetical protein n=1 Tax=Sphingobium yanoikuyae TaxID=13690 RepID=UPI0035C87035